MKTFNSLKVSRDRWTWIASSIRARTDRDLSELKASVEKWNICTAQATVAKRQAMQRHDAGLRGLSDSNMGSAGI